MMLVDLEKVSVRAGAVPILRDVNLNLGSGEAVAIFGGNGAGKTTLLRLIATLQPLSAGTGTVLGAGLDTAERFNVRPRIGYIGHAPGLYNEMTLLENLEFVAAVRGISPDLARDVLERVGLGAAVGRRVGHTSHGMQRRAEFARILMTEPDLLLLDEPHSSLDADAIDLVDGIVNRTLDGGGAAVLVSHDRQRVGSLVSRSYEIREGTLV